MKKIFVILCCLAFCQPLSIFAQGGADDNDTVISGQVCEDGSVLVTIPDINICSTKYGIASECTVCAFCGDGVLNPDAPLSEQCDTNVFAAQYSSYSPKICATDCTVKYCGDGILTTAAPLSEQCDGTSYASDYQYYTPKSCSATCRAEYCGDGIRQTSLQEQCDGRDPANVVCQPNCRQKGCGDGYVEAPETCDPYIAAGQPGYIAGCRAIGHTAQCTYCGDNQIQANEACDGTAKGTVTDPDAVCKTDCSGFNPYCGDGIPGNTAGEQCDDGNNVNNDACSNACNNPRCGDNIVQSGEQCDDGNTVNNDSCSNACTTPRCGDGIVQTGESCDDGNTVDTDLCSNTCQLTARCGDGIVGNTPGEVCDDGNTVNTDSCSNTCQPTARCGDGIVQSSRGEQCELPNTGGTLGRACNATCQNTCAKDVCGRNCGHADWGKACPVIKCETSRYLPNCNTYNGDGSKDCWKKKGSCNSFQLNEWCTRRVKGNNWDELHEDWVDDRCSGRVVLNGNTYSCYDPGSFTTYSCTTPLVLNFDVDTSVQYIADDGKSLFDLAGKNQPEQKRTDWPTSATPWLAYDRNGDGLINSGSELFGTGTSIEIENENAHFGFEALAVLDDNKDGQIDAKDKAFEKLLLWSDADANRISSNEELQKLSDRGIKSISLDFTLATKCDDRGNCENERSVFTWVDAKGQERKGQVIDVNLLTRNKLPE